MPVLAKRASDAPVEVPTPSVLAQGWVRVALGLGLLGLCVLMVVGALTMPFVVIRTSASTYYIGGAEQTGNLHLILAATGVIGAILAVIYAAGGASFRASFFVVGGVGTGFTALLLAMAWQTVSRGTVADPGIYAQIKKLETVMQIGSGLWACLVAGLGILALAVVVLLACRAADPPPPPPPGRARHF